MKKVFSLFTLFFILRICFAQSVGGSVGGSTTVCSGTNSGLLTLSGHTGSVVRWQSSTTSGAAWSNITNTTVNHVYANLNTTTWYRAEVLLAPSPPNISAFSTPAIITVDAASAGTVNTSASVCTGSNAGSLSLTGTFNNVAGWDSSTDAGANWIPIANTTTTQNYSNLTATTLYRATVTNGTCPASIAAAASITVNPLSVGGSIAGSTTVCATSNSGTLSLSGNTGNIIRWQSSDDGGASWSNISNTTSIYNFSNLEETTQYRAVVQSGNCMIENSSTATITVDPASVGGDISSAATVCSGSNNGTLVLSGHTGSIIRWESSIDGGNNWIPIVNTTDNYSYNNLAATTMYRAVVKSGGCASVNSTPVSITVSSASVGGTVSGANTVCSGSNSGTLTLNGNTGNIIRWQYSDDGGASWSNITNTTPFQNYSNISTTTTYRAVVQNTSCPAVNSAEATITVIPASDGGIVSSDATVCSGINNGTLQVTGYIGNILSWEKSINNGINWTSISNITDTLNYFNLTTKTLYRANVQSGNCPINKSTTAAITTSTLSAGGIISGSDTVCSGSNNGTLTLNGYVGSIVRWQSSDDGGVSWSNIGTTAGSTLYNYSNISTTTYYRAVVQNGACPADNSAYATITVLPVSAGGTLSPATYSACSGTNSGTMMLSGQSGNILHWESSLDGGTTWDTIANTTSSQNFQNLTASTKYRVLVQKGTCAAAYSTISTINVSPLSSGGTVNGSDTVCAGTNSGLMTLTGYTGSIQNWEYSVNGGVTWSNISNTSAIQNYTNLTTTTQYRAVVESGSCPAANSASATILVSPLSVGGHVLSSTSVCDSTTVGKLTLSGHTGSILNWESSADSGITWTNIPNTSTTQVYSGITKATMYKALVKSGACASQISTSATISLAVPAVGSYSFSVSGATAIFTNTSISNGGTNFWNFGDNTTSPITSPAHTYTANGSYPVTLIVTDSCGSDTAIQTVIVTGLGINEFYNSPDLVIYPNPFSSSATLSIQSSEFRVQGFRFIMYDVFGKQVKTLNIEPGTKNLQLERGDLPSGIYFYKLQATDEAIATGKIVIQ